MFGLFEKKGAKERLDNCLKKKDWDGVSKAYYDLGVAAMEQGSLYQAVLWLNRADTVYSASDKVYQHMSKNRLFRKEIVTDCSNRIGTLEETSLLYNTLPAEVEEKANELNQPQLRIWELLSIARLTKLGEALSKLPGCQVLGTLGWAVDIILQSLKEPITQEEYQKLMNICNGLYDFGDSQEFYAGGEIQVPGGAPFQVFDLNGMMGVHLEVNGYIDNHLRLLSALSQGKEPPEAEMFVLGCTLLPDYYVRTGTVNLENHPKIQAELERIWDDYDFVCSSPTWIQTAERIRNYKSLDLLQ